MTNDGHQFMTQTANLSSALGTISHSRDMVGAHQNLNGLRDPTTPLLGIVCHPWAGTRYDQPTYQIYEDTKGDTK